jgi:hypothetical protein
MRQIRFAHRAALLGASLAAVAVIASACGSATTSPPASDPSTSPAPSASPTSPGSPKPVPKPTPTLPQTGELSPTIPIDSVKLSPDGKKLTVSYYIGPAACHGSLDKAEVEQNASGVSVRLLRKPPAKQDEAIACVDIVELKTTEVTLDTPLGSRPVTDAGTDQPIKVTG